MIRHLAGRRTESFCSSCVRLRRMASPSRHNWRSCRLPAAIHLSLPICRKAQEIQAGPLMEKQSRSRVRPTRKTWPSRKRKKQKKTKEKKKTKEEEAKKAGNGNAPGGAVERESDVRVITRAIYRQDNEGYADPKHPTHIWSVDGPRSAAAKVKQRQLTTGRFDEESAIWSNDGSQIYFTSDRTDEPYSTLPKTDLYSVAAAGGKPVKITTIDLQIGGFGPGGAALSLSPTGKQGAFTASTTF